MTSTRTVSSAAEMLPLIELTDIRVYEVAGRRADAGDGDAARKVDEALTLHARGDSTWFETRARMLVRTEDADLVADTAAIYTFSEALAFSQDVATEFVERVGVMAVYPFLREQICSMATRLGVAPPIVGLLKAGQFTLDPPGEQADDS